MANRGRTEQSSVTTRHHVRNMTKAQKRDDKQQREVRKRGRPETTGISKGKAPSRMVKPKFSRFPPSVRNRIAEERDLEMKAALQRRSSLRSLLREQAADDARTQIQSCYVVSLDAARYDDSDESVSNAVIESEDDLGHVYTPRRRGQDSWGKWVELLCERVDYERLCDSIAALYEPRERQAITAPAGDERPLKLLLSERGTWTRDAKRAW